MDIVPPGRSNASKLSSPMNVEKFINFDCLSLETSIYETSLKLPNFFLQMFDLGSLLLNKRKYHENVNEHLGLHGGQYKLLDFYFRCQNQDMKILDIRLIDPPSNC